jgi:ligand-binding sensor domain-containing protein/AraC-like DNA-binding protein
MKIGEGRVCRKRPIGGGRLLLLFLLAAVHSFSLLALEPSRPLDKFLLRNWTTREGLASDTIVSLAQSGDGCLWIGTAKGLCRFDGLTFTRQKGHPLHRDVEERGMALFTGPGNRLWLVTLDGIFRFHNRQFVRVRLNDGQTAERMKRLFRDTRGNLWLVTGSGALSRWQNQRFEPLGSVGNLKIQAISAIMEDLGGDLWLGSREEGLFKLKKRAFIPFNGAGLAGRSYGVLCLAQDRRGTVWVGTDRGLWQLEGGQTKVYSLDHGLSHPQVTGILEDCHGSIWLGTPDGLNRLYRDAGGTVTIESRLRGCAVTALLEDGEKNLWLGTRHSGLKQLRDSTFGAYSSEDGLSLPVWSLFEDSTGTTWVGSGAGGLFYFANGRFFPLLPEDPLLTAGITAIAEDHEGALWLGTNGRGLLRLQGNQLTHFSAREGLSNPYIWTLCADRRGALWIGTANGLNRCRRDIFKTFTTEEGLLSNRVVNVYEDSRGDIWVATFKGLHVLRGGRFERAALETFFPGIPVSAIYEDSRRTFWIGTYGREFKRLRPDTVSSFILDSPREINIVSRILEDDRQNLWLCTNGGVFRVSKASLEGRQGRKISRAHLTFFDETDGLPSADCSYLTKNAAIKTRSGDLWVATKKGIAVTNSRMVKIDPLPPTAVIEKIVVDQTVFYPLEEGNVFDDAASIAIHFTAPTFVAPAGLTFKYTLTGLNEAWFTLEHGATRAAVYEDLPAGDYRFRVKAGDRNGAWSGEEASLRFTLKRSFWPTARFWAFVLGIALVILIIGYWLVKKLWLTKGKKYRQPILDADRAKAYLKKLDDLLEVDKVYLDENLSLQILAQKMSIAPYRLSRLINERLGQSFPDLVNSYRVGAAQKMLADPRYRDKTILDIGLEVGFNNKVVFNKAFKKYTHLTPSQYRKRHLDDRTL